MAEQYTDALAYNNPSGDSSSSAYGDWAQYYAASSIQRNANLANVYTNQMNNAFNAEQSQISRDWEKYKATHSYQWAMQDLKEAGINPYYLFNSGSGSGASASSTSASSGGSGSATGGANSAMQLVGTLIKIAGAIMLSM